MRTLLPWICLAFCLIAVSAMPWRRTDPHHDFIIDLLQHLNDDSESIGASGVTAPEAALLEHRTAAGNSDGNSRPRV
jgi:hypothetical protein